MAIDGGGQNIAYTVLTGLWIIPLAVLWFISLCLARKRQDPARVGVSWLKATYPVWIIALICDLIRGGLGTYQWYEDYYGYSYQSRKFWINISRASFHLGITGEFFETLANILLFVTLLELCSGFLLCLNGGQPTPLRKWSRIAMLPVGIVLFALSISLFGFNQSIAVRFYAGDLDGAAYTQANYVKDMVTLYRLAGAINILFWLVSIPVLGYAAYVVHRTRNNPVFRSGAILVLVAACLDFVRLLVSMAVDAAAVLTNPYRALVDDNGVDDAVTSIVEPLINYVFMFVLLVILFALAVRKANGLWSRPQPGWSFFTPYPAAGQVAYVGGGVGQQYPPPQFVPVAPMGQQPGQQLPAYLQVAHQQALHQQQQMQMQAQAQGHQVPPQAGYYYPANVAQPAPVHQQVEPPKPVAEMHAQPQ